MCQNDECLDKEEEMVHSIERNSNKAAVPLSLSILMVVDDLISVFCLFVNLINHF